MKTLYRFARSLLCFGRHQWNLDHWVPKIGGPGIPIQVCERCKKWRAQ